MPRILKRDPRIEIPGDWHRRDRHLYKLAQETGFQQVTLLIRHLAYEASLCRTPAAFYRALASFHEHATGKRRR